MPLYVYELVNDDGSGADVFELLQGIHEPPLERHPETGQAIRRVLAAPNVPRRWSDSRMKSKLSDRNLERLGFTKYQKSGDGTYEKRAGAGPDVISREALDRSSRLDG